MENHKGRIREFTGLSHRVIGCAIEVHRVLGPGMLESTYRRAFEHELQIHNIRCVSEQPIPLIYKGARLDGAFRLDLLIEEQIIVEVKCVAALTDIHRAQLLTYLKLTGLRTGFLFNFSQPRLMDGLVSLVL